MLCLKKHLAVSLAHCRDSTIRIISPSGSIVLGLPDSTSAQLPPEGHGGCCVVAKAGEEGLGWAGVGGMEDSSHRSAVGGPSVRASGLAAQGRRWAGAGAACSPCRWPAAGSSWPG